ncbi:MULTISPECIES: hypothetical protein [unclassified Enterococcus]|uniref:hypothetical protein n=1 Tax=unclassified Enterococcus TaxID=2608891 RepID=UPI001CE2271E|nr:MULTISPECIES: hypothetical protein [unclassified Enterococcus]MCA5014414.1 hypothetical protein [Enterococcus sp. S23]MCA5017473.1 hypothetical protein [Enterococcus sp. S22(2020)]
MTDKITVDPGELSGITGQLQTVIDELESSYNALQNIIGSEYYVEGLAQGQVGLFSIVTVRMEELISHYSRLQEYVTYAGETFVELDRSVSSDIKSKGK